MKDERKFSPTAFYKVFANSFVLASLTNRMIYFSSVGNLLEIEECLQLQWSSTPNIIFFLPQSSKCQSLVINHLK